MKLVYALPSLLALLVLLEACESPPPTHPPGPIDVESTNIPTPWGDITLRTDYYPPPPEESKQSVVDAPESVCWELRFYDGSNNEISSHAGSGSDVFTWPDGATKSVLAVVKCPTEEEDPPPPPGAAQGALSAGGTTLVRHRHLVLLHSHPADATEALTGVPFRSVTAWVNAAGFQGAINKLGSALDTGVGSPPPNGVEIIENSWVELTLTGMGVEVALPGEIEAFSVTLDDVVVADLDAALNVSAESLPNGWYRVGTSLPFSAIDPDASIVVRQQRLGLHEMVAQVHL